MSYPCAYELDGDAPPPSRIPIELEFDYEMKI